MSQFTTRLGLCSLRTMLHATIFYECQTSFQPENLVNFSSQDDQRVTKPNSNIPNEYFSTRKPRCRVRTCRDQSHVYLPVGLLSYRYLGKYRLDGSVGVGERTLVKQGNDFPYKDSKVAEVTEGRRKVNLEYVLVVQTSWLVPVCFGFEKALKWW